MSTTAVYQQIRLRCSSPVYPQWVLVALAPRTPTPTSVTLHAPQLYKEALDDISLFALAPIKLEWSIMVLLLDLPPECLQMILAKCFLMCGFKEALALIRDARHGQIYRIGRWKERNICRCRAGLGIRCKREKLWRCARKTLFQYHCGGEWHIFTSRQS